MSVSVFGALLRVGHICTSVGIVVLLVYEGRVELREAPLLGCRGHFGRSSTGRDGEVGKVHDEFGSGVIGKAAFLLLLGDKVNLSEDGETWAGDESGCFGGGQFQAGHSDKWRSNDGHEQREAF